LQKFALNKLILFLRKYFSKTLTGMSSAKTILITGAAGNLGGLLANYLKDSDLKLNLLIHRKDVAPDLKGLPNVHVFKADLNDSKSLKSALTGVDTVVHFAGVLFKHNPGKFLHRTNTKYFMNLLQQAIMCQVKRVILISFPHVEGESYAELPAKGEHYGVPNSVHAQTRQEEEGLCLDLENMWALNPWHCGLAWFTEGEYS